MYKAELTGAVSNGSHMPFWFTNNRYGLGNRTDNYAFLRGSIQRDVESDQARNWRIGYGLDAVASVGMDNHVILQQLYADVQWKVIRLSIGQKERPLEFKNQYLSSGAMTSGINARPLPQLRLELPDFWTIPRTKGWLAMKARIAYGAYTDNGWQRHFNAGEQKQIYTANSFYHTKALLLRIGNTEIFPATLSGGLEMCNQFGGKAWNVRRLIDSEPVYYNEKLPSGISAFWHALIPGGNDSNDGDFANKAGNHLGSWHMRFDGEWQRWKLGLYAEHFFEDESQMFLLYGWKDMLYGAEVGFPKNPIIQTLLYEHIGTRDQSGPIYHDATETLPVQISGLDEYYNNHIYGAWQHAGFSMGSPLLLSPLYNNNHAISVLHNRITAHHLGIMGQPISELSYRLLYSHEKSWGTYVHPLIDPQKANYLLAELSYMPQWLPGFTIKVSYGHNDGKLLGGSNGGMLTFSYSGLINRTSK